MILTSLFLTSALAAQEPAPGNIVPELYSAHGDAVRQMDEHITFLSNAFLGGRLPGTPGMHITERYVLEHFEAAGLQPAFQDEDGNPSWRQSVPLGAQRTLGEISLTVGDWQGTPGETFGASMSGGSGDATGELVFAGYSIVNGPGDYNTYSGDNDLEGKIAVIYRFEPLNDEGNSAWSQNGRWTAQAGFTPKLQQAAERGAAGILIVNPPGLNDPRAGELPTGRQNRQRVDIPVGAISLDAFNAMLSKSKVDKDALALRKLADEEGFVLPLGLSTRLQIEIAEEVTFADNIGGLLPGRGALANEVVVMGAHIDHLGMGVYGSRGFRGQLHPGADDNASGTAAIIMLAERLVPWMNKLPESTPARSILFLGLNAEEAGLDGAWHYVRNPIRPIEQHSLMVNFDMIGRVTDKKVQILGLETGEGMADWVQRLGEQSPLKLREVAWRNLGSDHIPFIQSGVPAMFAIIDPLHQDYHTPGDVAWKINRVDAVHVVDLFEAVLQGGALMPERHKFVAP